MRHFTRDERVTARTALNEYHNKVDNLWEEMLFNLETELNLDPESAAILLGEEDK